MRSITALILAAGKGKRFGEGSMPKQFRQIAGKELFVHSALIYAALTEVDRIILTANPNCVEQARAAITRHGLPKTIEIVGGGDTRQASVRNAMAALTKDGDPGRNDLIVVHNGVSPNTRAEFVRDCLASIHDYDVVQACIPDTRTVVETSGGEVRRVLPRSRLAYNCDPTIYRGDAFMSVLQAQIEAGSGGETTIDTALELGFRIRCVESTFDNIKVTNPWDLAAVRAAMEAD